jgi:hypothetical protein
MFTCKVSGKSECSKGMSIEVEEREELGEGSEAVVVFGS